MKPKEDPCRWAKEIFRACLHKGEGPQVGDVTRLGGVTRLSIYDLLF